ncbi:MAG: hypothetical protein ACK5O3_08000 [Burkholderiales bacterium]
MNKLLAAMAALVLLPAQAGRPFITEDAGILEQKACEWESVAAQARVPGEARSRSAATQVGCGLGFRSQLAVNVAQERLGGERSNSVGLGGKTGLWEADAGGPSLTLAWGTSWSKGRASPREWDGVSALLALQQPLGDGWTLHGNLGRSYSRSERRSSSFWALLAERNLSDSIDAGVELFSEAGQRPGLGVGMRWRLAEGWTLDGSLARSGSRPRERLVTLGFKREF